MSLIVISTGGTIGALPYEDPKKPPRNATFPPDDQDRVRAFVNALGLVGARYVNAGYKDSKQIDEAYRSELFRLAADAPEDKVLITHGTDALLRTADFLFRYAAQSPVLAQKTILLTGSMTPLANGPESDGYLNLTFSIDLLLREKAGKGVSIVLCDFDEPEARTGWKPHLYRYEFGKYEKFFDLQDGRFNRIRSSGRVS